ncbi:hypothetical protein V8G54_023240, partial [Vigna mungo]
MNIEVGLAYSGSLSSKYFVKICPRYRWWQDLWNRQEHKNYYSSIMSKKMKFWSSTVIKICISLNTCEASPFAASSCIVICIALCCFGPHGIHMPSGFLKKNMASWVLRTGSNKTSLTQTAISEPENPSVLRAK